MAATARVPFMVAATGGAAVPDSPVVRVLGSDEVGLHVDAMRDVFGLPDELLRGSALLDYDGVTGYVTEDGGDVAGTALGIVRQGHVGVFNVATRPASRGRGHGAALTARVLADGAAAGAGTALLQSSPLAVPLYERAGFAIAEHWTVWIG